MIVTFASTLRAEALKFRHAAPARIAVLMALPMPLLGAMPVHGYQSFSAWNYWYTLFLPSPSRFWSPASPKPTRACA